MARAPCCLSAPRSPPPPSPWAGGRSAGAAGPAVLVLPPLGRPGPRPALLYRARRGQVTGAGRGPGRACGKPLWPRPLVMNGLLTGPAAAGFVPRSSVGASSHARVCLGSGSQHFPVPERAIPPPLECDWPETSGNPPDTVRATVRPQRTESQQLTSLGWPPRYSEGLAGPRPPPQPSARGGPFVAR